MNLKLTDGRSIPVSFVHLPNPCICLIGHGGDDPYWTAVDLHYWLTGDLEYYDPKQITTKGGSLVISFDRANPDTNHNLSFVSGMLQSWNQFCFTGGILEGSILHVARPAVTLIDAPIR
jgi:hypothetical protein